MMAPTVPTPTPTTLRVSLAFLARTIDHSLLHPTMTRATITSGLALARKYSTATACIPAWAIPLAKQHLDGSSVAICPVIAFPHGSTSTAAKVLEAEEVCRELGSEWIATAELDMVVNIGMVLGHEWEGVEDEIRRVNDVVLRAGAAGLKVIFENDFLEDEEKRELCKICTKVGVAFIKTSTGYGFVKGTDGRYSYQGATRRDLILMRREAGEKIKIKAAGGVRTLDELLGVLALGVDRVGASATEAILEEAKQRGIGEDTVEVKVPVVKEQVNGGAY